MYSGWELFSVDGMFQGSDVPSLQGTPWMKAQVVVSN